jgi:carbamoyl-phosphate synthase small subunit
MSLPAALALEDGRVFGGESFGAPIAAEGEVVFSTSMTGYQEMCTDPSYCGQLLCLTYPLVGNYGVSPLHDQAARPWVAGLVVRSHTLRPSHWSSEGTLDAYLRERGVPGVSGVDTRALTRHIRAHGSMRGVIAVGADALDRAALVARARVATLPSELGAIRLAGTGATPPGLPLDAAHRPRVVIIDCGLKTAIARDLAERGAEVIVLPYSATPEELLALEPDGLVTSPGPGDPEDAEACARTVKAALDRRLPFFGVCLGHQILGLAIGATTSKLKFGHRGANHPVKEIATGRVRATSQNHGYQVDAASVPLGDGWRISHVNVTDGSVEGLSHPELPAFSVQYHPEGSPGPEENEGLFDAFLAMVGARLRREAE